MNKHYLLPAFMALALFSCSEKASDLTCVPACNDDQVCTLGVCEDSVKECTDGKVDCKDGAGCVLLAETQRSACDACLEGYADCDADMKNGCEVKLDSDSHCGACNVACTENQSCKIGNDGATCEVKGTEECTDGKVDCKDGAGCVLLAETQRSACDACLEGYADCDADMKNGCEVKLDSDSHCGACNVVCTENQSCKIGNDGATCEVKGTEECTDGKVDCKDGAGCVLLADSHRSACDACLEGYGDCDADMKNGCEVKLDVTAHCGACNNNCKVKLKEKGICASVEGNVHCTNTCDPDDDYDSQDFCYADVTKPDSPGVLLKCVPDDRDSKVYVMAQVANYCGDNVFYSCELVKGDYDIDYEATMKDCSSFANGICAPGVGCVSNKECSETDVNFCNKKVMNNCVKAGDKYYWQEINCNTLIKNEYPGKNLEGACSKVDAKTVACEAICLNDGTWEFGMCEQAMSRISYCNPDTGLARYETCINSCTDEFIDGVEKPVCF